MMGLEASWHPLISSEDIPVVYLIKYKFHDKGYEIYVTDLRNLWSEILDVKSIAKRAAEIESSIDPSDDSSQQDILLERLFKALQGEALSVLYLPSYGNESYGISLEVEVSLPKPLSNLHWIFKLVSGDDASQSTQFTAPLVQRLDQVSCDVTDLQARLAEKDHVISRLVERLEASGTDLTSVFPGTTNIKINRKQSQRSQLGKYVKGLDHFEAGSWVRNRHEIQEIEHLGGVLNNIQSVSDKSLLLSIGGYSDRIPSTRTSSKGLSAKESQTKINNTASSAASGPNPSSDTETESEEETFEEQHVASGNTEAHEEQVKDANVTDDTSKNVKRVSLARSPDASHMSTKPNPTVTHRIGMVGRQKIAKSDAQKHSSEPETMKPGEAKSQSKAAEKDTTVVAHASPSKKKIGMVGGRKTDLKTSSPGDLDKEEAGSSANDAHVSSLEKPTQDDGDDGRHSRSHSMDRKTSPIRETSQERAAKRRDELKRQLDAPDSSIVAKKKKRKF